MWPLGGFKQLWSAFSPSLVGFSSCPLFSLRFSAAIWPCSRPMLTLHRGRPTTSRQSQLDMYQMPMMAPVLYMQPQAPQRRNRFSPRPSGAALTGCPFRKCSKRSRRNLFGVCVVRPHEHPRAQCFHREATYTACAEQGRLEKVCRKTKMTAALASKQPKRPKPKITLASSAG